VAAVSRAKSAGIVKRASSSGVFRTMLVATPSMRESSRGFFPVVSRLMPRK